MAQEKKSQKITKEEALQIENFALRLQTLASQKELTEGRREAFMRELHRKYQIGERDGIDLWTLEIRRAKEQEKPAP